MDIELVHMFKDTAIVDVITNEAGTMHIQKDGAKFDLMPINNRIYNLMMHYDSSRNLQRIYFNVDIPEWVSVVLNCPSVNNIMIENNDRIIHVWQVFVTEDETGMIGYEYNHLRSFEQPSFTRTIERCKTFKEELMMKTWHPDVIAKRLAQGREDLIWDD